MSNFLIKGGTNTLDRKKVELTRKYMENYKFEFVCLKGDVSYLPDGRRIPPRHMELSDGPGGRGLL